MPFRPVGRLVLVGKNEGLMTYEPLVEARAAHPKMEAYARAYDLLQADDPKARDAFAEVQSLDPDDGLAAFHIARLDGGEHGDLIVMKRK